MTEDNMNGNEYDIPESERVEDEAESIAAEFAALGKRFGEALSAAWQSEERHRLQEDIKDGLDRFTAEVDKAVKELRKSDVAQKVEEGTQKATEDVKTGKVGSEVRHATVTALRGLSEALDRMASSFTPAEGEEMADEENPPVV